MHGVRGVLSRLEAGTGDRLGGARQAKLESLLGSGRWPDGDCSSCHSDAREGDYGQGSIRRASSLRDVVDRALDEQGKEGSMAITRQASKAFLDKALVNTIESSYLPVSPVSNFELIMWVIFGASGWWAGNAVFAELPFFVIRLPARQKLGSQLALMTQLGNIFVIVYKVMENRYSPSIPHVIYGMMCVSTVSLLGCAFAWDLLIQGESIPLLFFMMISGGMGCMSNSTYWALMISYPRVCTKAVGLGMSLGGVMVNLFAAAQMGGRPQSEPRFGARTFFVLAAAVQVCCASVVAWQTRKGYDENGEPGTIARALSRVSCISGVSSNTSSEPHAESRAGQIQVLNLGIFVLCAAVYTLPTLLPFVASAYPSSEQQLLLWMLFSQQVGESLGRACAPVQTAKGAFPRISIAILLTVFLIFLGGAIHRNWLAYLLPQEVAVVGLPLMVVGGYFSYGILQTVIFLRARTVSEDMFEAAHAASTMGFLGQMGALSANLLSSAVVNR